MAAATAYIPSSREGRSLSQAHLDTVVELWPSEAVGDEVERAVIPAAVLGKAAALREGERVGVVCTGLACQSSRAAVPCMARDGRQRALRQRPGRGARAGRSPRSTDGRSFRDCGSSASIAIPTGSASRQASRSTCPDSWARIRAFIAVVSGSSGKTWFWTVTQRSSCSMPETGHDLDGHRWILRHDVPPQSSSHKSSL